MSLDREHPQFFDNRAQLYIVRTDLKFGKAGKACSKARMLDMPDLNERRSGALVAVYRYVGKHLKVGAGYNFTDFSDDLTDLSFIATLTALAATLIAPLTSHAILVTLDNPNQTILRPTTGTTTVSFTGNIDITGSGHRLTSAAATSLWNASGDLVEGRFPRPTFDLTGVLFTVLVGATDSGLYAFDSLLTNPAYILFAECPLGAATATTPVA